MNHMNDRRPAWRACAGILLVAFTVTMCPGLGWVGAAFADVRADMDQARYHFDFSEYAEAAELLDGVIAGGELSGDGLRDAYVLRARCSMAMGQDTMARDDFCEVVRLDADWRPDPVEYTQDEVAGFEAARADCLQAVPEPVVAPEPAEDEGGTPFYAKPVVWVVAGVAVVAGVLLAGGGGDDETPPVEDPISDPPEPPTK